MWPVLVTLAGFAVLAALLAGSHGLAGRRWAMAGHLLLALALGIVVSQGWPFAGYLDTYEARAPQNPVADVLFERIGPRRFRVALTRLPSGRMQVVELPGQEWRLELRTLDWSDQARRLGASPRYRIEALASRPAPSTESGPPLGLTANLSQADAEVPWLGRLGLHPDRPLVTTRPVAGPWQPMAHGARFEVRLTAANGVEVAPLNAAASDSLPVP